MKDAAVGGYPALRKPSETGAMVLQSPLLARAGVRHGFGTRVGGVSRGSFASLNFGLKGGDAPRHVADNEERLGATVGFHPARLFRLWQVHGRRVINVTHASEPGEVRVEEADALVSAAPGAALGVGTADCVPVLLAAPHGRAVGAAHAGWRGLVGGVLQAVVEALVDELGCEVGSLLAAIGPCIGPCCYEVGPEVAAAFTDTPGAVILRDPRPHLDLTHAAARELERAGLDLSNVDRPQGVCTRCQNELFFSYRRDADATGHHLSVVVAGG